MKRSRIFAIAAFTAFMLAGPSLAADQGKISVHVDGVNNDKGVVRIALFNSEGAYAGPESNTGQGSLMKAAVPPKANKADYVFEDVPYGDYAIKVFHDEENSGEFLTGPFGMPKVQYGFSNNAKGMFGPAPFKKAKFTLNQAELPMTITLQGK